MSDLKEFPIDQMHKEVETIYHILNESLKPIQDPKTVKKYEFPDLKVISLKQLETCLKTYQIELKFNRHKIRNKFTPQANRIKRKLEIIHLHMLL